MQDRPQGCPHHLAGVGVLFLRQDRGPRARGGGLTYLVVHEGMVSQQHGLPCRGGCSLVFNPANTDTREALLVSIGERVVHEEVVHQYVHVPTPVTKFGYGMKTRHGRKGLA